MSQPLYKPQIGVSFSARHARSLGLDPGQALEKCCTWPISTIRLGAYWDELEPQENAFSFQSLIAQLEICQAHQIDVVLTVGVKAPRWPEFYFPSHVEPDIFNPETQRALLNFIAKAIEITKSFDCIKIWQIENEPLDPSGPENKVVPLEFLQLEAALVRQLDPRPQLISVWGNNLLERQNLNHLHTWAENIGLDIYYKQFVTKVLGRSIYRGPDDSDAKLSQVVSSSPVAVWITELQAEPWEADDAGYRSAQPQSFNLSQLKANWQRALQLSVRGILFWGAEYWIWQEQQGNPEYVSWIKSLEAES